ncbi:MAG: hypothetical protein IJX62_07445 [Clostridia bacterium]|nr:hypothetical protein [Clostridia bacterium]
MIELGQKREVFWDDYLVDNEKTTAFQRLMHPEKKEVSFVFKNEEIKDVLMFFSILKDDKGYKLYYLDWKDGAGEPVEKRYLAVLESQDGIAWSQPDLNIYPYPEFKGHNNVVLQGADSAFVFYDENPQCPIEEKYKIVTPYYCEKPNGKAALELWAMTSPDGYHFKLSHCIETEGHFDSLNTAHYRNGQYACYFRSFHDRDGNDTKIWNTDNFRDIRLITSKDFKNWSRQQRLQYSDGMDYQLYTNNIFPYERAPHILVGFPTRYVGKKEWTDNMEQLKSASLKKWLIKNDCSGPRAGLAITDSVFMCSRDGVNFSRFNEAFLSCGPEEENNWVYGDNYFAYNMIDSGRDTYYMYCMENRRSYELDKSLYRYEIRKDGFACYMADGEEKVLVTKPLVFDGKDLHLNFSTSAFGYIYIDVLNEKGEKISEDSFEIFGNTIDRKIPFADGASFEEFAGKPVRLRFRMRDAKLFSLKFE